MIAGIVIVTVGIYRAGETPHAATYIWWLFLWWILSLVALVPSLRPLVAGVGGLVLLAVGMKYGPAAFLGSGEIPESTKAGATGIFFNKNATQGSSPNLQGSKPNLQGSTPNLQGSTPKLQGSTPKLQG